VKLLGSLAICRESDKNDFHGVTWGRNQGKDKGRRIKDKDWDVMGREKPTVIVNRVRAGLWLEINSTLVL
jgi:hypothetical protein